MTDFLSFKDPLILALERGDKTLTRRLLNPQPSQPHGWYPSAERGHHYANEVHFRRGVAEDHSPYRVGARLWVKQALHRDPDNYIRYTSNNSLVTGTNGWREVWPWKPAKLGAMYCPRWASRLTLEVLSVRPERLQEITESDARAEGVSLPECAYLGKCNSRHCPRHRADAHRRAFVDLWDSINGDRCPWEGNPWVWRVEFRRVA